MSSLNLDVLVLNRHYYPVHVASVQDAFIMLCKGTAEAVTVEDGHYHGYDLSSWYELSELKQTLGIMSDDDWISTSQLELIVPKVIRALQYSDTVEQKVILTRRNIYYRDNHTCQYCGKTFKTEDLTWDHVNPRSKGGRNTWENLVTCCRRCNNKKGSLSLSQSGMKLLRVPFKPKFIPNFRLQITNSKYMIWRHFVSEMYWNLELQDE